MHILRKTSSESIRSKFRPAWFRPAALAVLLLFPTHAFAVDSAFVGSLLVPGLGQAHQGHYTRSAVFAGAAVLSGFGLLVAQVHYNEAVDKLDAQKRIYASYEETLSEGGVVSIVDLEGTYSEMEASFNAAEDRLVWRNAFLVGFVATYAVNLIDVLVSKPYDVERDPRLSVDVSPTGGVRITKAFRF
jgi:hypothetical protein